MIPCARSLPTASRSTRAEEYDYWRNQPPPPDSLTAWLIRHRRALHFDDLAAELEQYPELGQNLIGAGKHAVSWLGVPLLSRDGAAIGAISVQSYRPAAFDSRDEAFLSNVVRQVTLHVQNVALLAQRERQIYELDAIGRIGELISASFDLDEMLDVVHHTLQEATSASVFFLLICEPETHIVTHRDVCRGARADQLALERPAAHARQPDRLDSAPRRAAAVPRSPRRAREASRAGYDARCR